MDARGRVEQLRRLVPALWAGALLAIGGLAAPAAFAVLPAAQAGRVNGSLFAHEAWMSIGLALALWFLEDRRARSAAEAGQGSRLSTEMLLVLGALFCTVAGGFGLPPLMAAARAGQGGLGFGVLHGLSVALYAVKLVLVWLLAWRAAAR